MMKKAIGIGIVLIVVIAAFAVQQKEAAAPVPEDDRQQAGETSQPAPGSEELSRFEQITLDDVTDGDGEGAATRLYDATGMFIHTVDATLPEPASGSVYEGWLVRGEPGDEDFDFISTGVMELEGGEMYSLVFSSETDYADYPGVVITEETVVDETPEAHILEGSF